MHLILRYVGVCLSWTAILGAVEAVEGLPFLKPDFVYRMG